MGLINNAGEIQEEEIQEESYGWSTDADEIQEEPYGWSIDACEICYLDHCASLGFSFIESISNNSIRTIFACSQNCLLKILLNHYQIYNNIEIYYEKKFQQSQEWEDRIRYCEIKNHNEQILQKIYYSSNLLLSNDYLFM